MQTKNGGGDKLARGMVRATFQASEGTTSQEAWDAMWKDFDAEAFRNAPNPAQQHIEKEDE